MKKFLLALTALAFAVAISSCADRGCFNSEKSCKKIYEKSDDEGDDESDNYQSQERSHRRW